MLAAQRAHPAVLLEAAEAVDVAVAVAAARDERAVVKARRRRGCAGAGVAARRQLRVHAERLEDAAERQAAAVLERACGTGQALVKKGLGGPAVSVL